MEALSLLTAAIASVPHYAIVVVILESARRFISLAYGSYCVKWNRRVDPDFYLGDFVKASQATFIPFSIFLILSYVGAAKFIGQEGLEDDPLTALLVSLIVLSVFWILHQSLTMTPTERKEKLKYELHNIGPVLAKSFANVVKIGLRNKAAVNKALEKYKQEQGIGAHRKMAGNETDFMTNKIVILFPQNLVKFSEKFEKGVLNVFFLTLR